MPGRKKTISDYVVALKGEEFQDVNKYKLWNVARSAIAEFIGTAIFVGVGCSSLVIFPGSSLVHLHVVFSFAFAVTLVISAFGHISGAFVNPSLALAAVILGKLSLPMFLIYTVSQCMGAAFGIAAVKAISPSECINDDFCVTLPDNLLNVYKALLAEALTTFCLAMVLASVLDSRNSDKMDSVAIKFGFTVAALAIPGAKYTGCSMNPARSFGPALLSGVWRHHWIYWVGPLTGAASAGFLYQVLFAEEKRPQPKSDSVNLET